MAKYHSKSGVGIYEDYRENIICDADHPILKWKANKKKERLPDGSPYIASEHSEDALSWNLFRSLQLTGKLSLVMDTLPIQVDVQELYFWQHAVSRQSQDTDPEIQDVLNEMEPWGWNGRRQQTETDVILRGRHQIVVVECKLGKPDAMVRAWSRSGSTSRPMRSNYLSFMEKLGVKLFNKSFDLEGDGRRFYQLFRNYLLGAALCQKWDTEFSLVTIVNSLNSNLDGKSHEEEFGYFQSKLVQPSNAFLITWQQIWGKLGEEAGLEALQKWLVNHCLLGLSS